MLHPIQRFTRFGVGYPIQSQRSCLWIGYPIQSRSFIICCFNWQIFRLVTLGSFFGYRNSPWIIFRLEKLPSGHFRLMELPCAHFSVKGITLDSFFGYRNSLWVIFQLEKFSFSNFSVNEIPLVLFFG
jgi:hypothetical protein